MRGRHEHETHRSELQVELGEVALEVEPRGDQRARGDLQHDDGAVVELGELGQ